MEMPHSTEEGRRDVQAGPWGLGDRRTLDDFIEFTGVSGLFSLYGVLFVAFVFLCFMLVHAAASLAHVYALPTMHTYVQQSMTL